MSATNAASATDWYTPPMGSRSDPAEIRTHMLGNRVMGLEGELREVQDENSLLRKQQVVLVASVKELSDEVLRVTKLLIAEREGRRATRHAKG